MWRWTKRILAGLGGFVALATITGIAYQWIATRRDLATAPPPGKLVDVGGHRLHIWCSGSGAPTVLLEAGLGGWSVEWARVQPEVARFTRVCAYDRAGMGYSDAGPGPRTSRRIAQELNALLDKSDLGGPVVIVAASFGGYNAR